MIGYCPSAGRIQPRHLLSFSTDSTAIAQVNRSRIARVFLSLPLSFSPLSSRPRATSASSHAVRFGIDAAADAGKKKIGQHDGKLCPRRGERRYGLTDLLQRPRTPRTLRFFSSLFANSPAPDHFLALSFSLSECNPRPLS